MGEPWQAGKLGKTHDLVRDTFNRPETGAEFNFPAAETSRSPLNPAFEQPHIFSISSCLRRLSEASLLSSGSTKSGSMGGGKLVEESFQVWKVHFDGCRRNPPKRGELRAVENCLFPSVFSDSAFLALRSYRTAPLLRDTDR